METNMEENNETNEPNEPTAQASEAGEVPAAELSPPPGPPMPLEPGTDRGRRAEKIGIVTSDKMTRTVTVRVDRLVKHPVYKRYVRRRSKFMAHNEVEGVSMGDTVRIVETRPLSAKKRWRVVEVVRKASK